MTDFGTDAWTHSFFAYKKVFIISTYLPVLASTRPDFMSGSYKILKERGAKCSTGKNQLYTYKTNSSSRLSQTVGDDICTSLYYKVLNPNLQ